MFTSNSASGSTPSRPLAADRLLTKIVYLFLSSMLHTADEAPEHVQGGTVLEDLRILSLSECATRICVCFHWGYNEILTDGPSDPSESMRPHGRLFATQDTADTNIEAPIPVIGHDLAHPPLFPALTEFRVRFEDEEWDRLQDDGSAFVRLLEHMPLLETLVVDFSEAYETVGIEPRVFTVVLAPLLDALAAPSPALCPALRAVVIDFGRRGCHDRSKMVSGWRRLLNGRAVLRRDGGRPVMVSAEFVYCEGEKVQIIRSDFPPLAPRIAQAGGKVQAIRGG
ncbi:uncharacterized protein BXZ73DRAFT_80373 [Epithele typhae]|uniref:uncharacterized protein n=1 Tax=Epithele typhae TaxID=378194 RepID=UPI002007D751|nr:uncharacterized protein BXZ73DRAFT_80373 [Epithele typhae]KAH9919153.1 hypothetical protein BXZ73DRAFT_80373 [Epithele typhae]